MNMFEEAEALAGTVALCRVTQEEFADKLGVSQSYVANKLRLLKFSPELRLAILEGHLSERHARAILRLSDDKDRKLAVAAAVRENMTVAETEAFVEVLHTSEGTDADAMTARLDGLFSDLFRIFAQKGIRAEKTVTENDRGTVISLFIERKDTAKL
ncbi:MAG: hypothetical protein MJ082_04915 [Clostridia bacterium]|nr:hypothetical protein [Clostridia bacterium]